MLTQESPLEVLVLLPKRHVRAKRVPETQAQTPLFGVRLDQRQVVRPPLVWPFGRKTRLSYTRSVRRSSRARRGSPNASSFTRGMLGQAAACPGTQIATSWSLASRQRLTIDEPKPEQLAASHPGAGQGDDHEPVEQVRQSPRRVHERDSLGVVEEPRQGPVESGTVAGVDRDPCRGVVVTAVGDEDPAFADADIAEPQPEDLAAAGPCGPGSPFSPCLLQVSWVSFRPHASPLSASMTRCGHYRAGGEDSALGRCCCATSVAS